MTTTELVTLARTTCTALVAEDGVWAIRTPGGISLQCDRAAGTWLRHHPWVGWRPVSADEVLALIRA